MIALLPEILSGLAAVAVGATSGAALSRIRDALREIRSRERTRDAEIAKARDAIARDVGQLLSTERMNRDAADILEDLLEHLNDVDRAVLLLGNLLVAKGDGNVQVRRLDEREQTLIDTHQDWLKDPNVMIRLDSALAEEKRA